MDKQQAAEAYAKKVAGSRFTETNERAIAEHAKRDHNAGWEAHEAQCAAQPAGPVWVKASERLPAEGTTCAIKYLHGRIRIVDAKYWGTMNNAPLWIENKESRPQAYTAIEWLDESGPPVSSRDQIDMAFYGACNAINRILGDKAIPVETIAEVHKEYMQLNYAGKEAQVFTREQIEAAYKEAYYRASITPNASDPSRDADEYMDTNYPTK
jgi:hypothetical protein